MPDSRRSNARPAGLARISLARFWRSVPSDACAQEGPMAGTRWLRKVRERIERERDEAVGQLRELGITPESGAAEPDAIGINARDEGDQAQASERQDISFMTRERVANRI